MRNLMQSYRPSIVGIVFAAAAIAGSVSTVSFAQTPSAPPQTFVSAADMAAAVAKAAAAVRPDVPMNGGALLRLAPYSANLEYRTSVGPAAIHEKEAELVYVLEGSGSLIIGGKLVAATRRNAENLSGTSIEGGSLQKLVKGDMLIIPENTAHWFNSIDGKLVLVTLHVPRTAAAP
jgi:mannose-6-phosphate isomerase-like protein (cupin superfamily)